MPPAGPASRVPGGPDPLSRHGVRSGRLRSPASLRPSVLKARVLAGGSVRALVPVLSLLKVLEVGGRLPVVTGAHALALPYRSGP